MFDGSDEVTDRESLPAWWQRAVEHFDSHDLIPYQPPRFVDGTLKHTVEQDLEEQFGITIAHRCKNGKVGDDWTVLVDGQPVGTIGRYRCREGYTVYEIEPDEFRCLIRSALTSS